MSTMPTNIVLYCSLLTSRVTSRGPASGIQARSIRIVPVAENVTPALVK